MPARTHCWKCGTPLHRVSMVDAEGWTNGVTQCETQGCVSDLGLSPPGNGIN